MICFRVLIFVIANRELSNSNQRKESDYFELVEDRSFGFSSLF